MSDSIGRWHAPRHHQHARRLSGKSTGRGAAESDDAVFTRLLYWGVTTLGLIPAQVWLTPYGLLLDLIECRKHSTGLAEPFREVFIDEIIPFGV